MRKSSKSAAASRGHNRFPSKGERTRENLIVLVSAPNLKTARALARVALEDRLVACANLISKIESHYWWQGKLETSTESLVLFKTSASRVSALEKLIIANHPYDTPEFIAFSVDHVNKRYLAWWQESLRTS
jgi:periplasmic divalent cation tolerance protein